MIRFLPFILVPLLILGGLLYLRSASNKQNQISPKSEIQSSAEPVEVPKTLPGATAEQRIKALEEAFNKLVPQVNTLISSAPASKTSDSTSLDARITALETGITDLKVSVSALEKRPVNAQTSGKSSTVYIPLGSGGSQGDKDWVANNNYGVSIDPAEYPGYSSMQLEVNFRLVQKSGTAYARLYNATDSNAKEQVSTTSDVFGWQTSFGFTLPSGKKTYNLQVKSTEGVEVQIQSARIKVNF